MSEIYTERIEAACYKGAEILILHGASPYEVDESMVAFGFQMGPYEIQDLCGLDLSYQRRKSELEQKFPHLYDLTISDRMVEDGKLGKKVNAGWYRYPGGEGKVEDPIVEDLVLEEAWFAKVKRQTFSLQQCQSFILASIINEACRILDDEINFTLQDMNNIASQTSLFSHAKISLLEVVEQMSAQTILASLNQMKSADELFCSPAKGILVADQNDITLRGFYKR